MDLLILLKTMPCIFCKIIAGEIPASKVYEDDKVMAFLDINPVNFGHILVIPKKHFIWMTETPDEVVADVFIKSKKIMIAIQKATGADLVSVAVVGKDVPHFHVHLVPRFSDDGLAGWWPTRKYGAGEIDKTAEKIKKAI